MKNNFLEFFGYWHRVVSASQSVWRTHVLIPLGLAQVPEGDYPCHCFCPTIWPCSFGLKRELGWAWFHIQNKKPLRAIKSLITGFIPS